MERRTDMLLRLFGKRFRKSGRPLWLRDIVLQSESYRLSRLPFYRINPPVGRMPLVELDHSCVVDSKHKIFYHRIPKNANSSLVMSVRRIMEGREMSTSIDDKRRLKKETIRPSMLDAVEAQKVSSYFKFFVVRNPYDRALSAYLSKVVRLAKEGKPSLMGNFRPAEDVPTFEEFCQFLARGNLRRDRHWTPQVDYLVFPVERYDFIVRLETIDQDFKTLAQKLGRESPGLSMVAEDPRHSTGAAARHREFYTPALYELVYEAYRRDFEAFGYDRIAG